MQRPKVHRTNIKDEDRMMFILQQNVPLYGISFEFETAELQKRFTKFLGLTCNLGKLQNFYFTVTLPINENESVTIREFVNKIFIETVKVETFLKTLTKFSGG